MKCFKNGEIFDKFMFISFLSVCTMFMTALFVGFCAVTFIANDHSIWPIVVGVLLILNIHLLSLFYIMKE